MKKAFPFISLLLISILGSNLAHASCTHLALENTQTRGAQLSRRINRSTRVPFLAILGISAANVFAQADIQVSGGIVSTSILAAIFGDDVGDVLNGYQRGADLLRTAWAWRQKRYGDLYGYGRSELARTARLVGDARGSELSLDLIADMIVHADLNESFCVTDQNSASKKPTFTRFDIIQSLIGNDEAFKFALARSDAASDQIELLLDNDPTNDAALESSGSFTCLDLATSMTVEKASQFKTRAGLTGYGLAMGSFLTSMFAPKAIPGAVLFGTFGVGAVLDVAAQPFNSYRKGYQLLQAAHDAKEGSQLELLSNETLSRLKRAAEITLGASEPAQIRQVAALIREADRKRAFCPPIERVDLDGRKTYHFKGYTHHDILNAIRVPAEASVTRK